jgi:hypothetical protein
MRWLRTSLRPLNTRMVAGLRPGSGAPNARLGLKAQGFSRQESFTTVQSGIYAQGFLNSQTAASSHSGLCPVWPLPA